jgi:threonine/homoserine/homoserine lactone efflux protein
LLGFGLALFFKKPPSLEQLRSTAVRESSIPVLWGKGFLVNTANPFTIFFWLVTMTNGVIERSFGGGQVLQFFGGIMGTIILTDFLKAYFADALRKKLRPVHLKWFGRVAGIIVMGFGLAIIGQGVKG